MKQKSKSIVVAILIALINFPLFLYGFGYEPIGTSTSNKFWKYAVGVDVDNNKWASPPNWLVYDYGIYPPVEGWFVYYVQTQHDQALFKVHRQDAEKYFSKVIHLLRKSQRLNTVKSHVSKGFQAWLRESTNLQENGILLIEKIYEARLAEIKENDPDLYQYHLAEAKLFLKRWERAKYYLITLAFEFFYLTGLILFTAWPWLKEAGKISWSIHMGLSPVLLFLPYFLGYPPFLSISAPTGGFIYPTMVVFSISFLIFFRNFFIFLSPYDEIIGRVIPQVLEPLSQIPGPALSATYIGGIGPVSTLCLGIVTGIVTFILISLISGMKEPD